MFVDIAGQLRYFGEEQTAGKRDFVTISLLTSLHISRKSSFYHHKSVLSAFYVNTTPLLHSTFYPSGRKFG